MNHSTPTPVKQTHHSNPNETPPTRRCSPRLLSKERSQQDSFSKTVSSSSSRHLLPPGVGNDAVQKDKGSKQSNNKVSTSKKVKSAVRGVKTSISKVKTTGQTDVLIKKCLRN
mmetsp:Transcript_15219/g.28637  ORF Transcript_15219/g.28637 Transcript_15219/m.28637 type:complete len:113 (-) Transcript_15219:1316-1654(-)